MDNFTPGAALAGGLLIGTATSLLLLLNGRVAGVSGIVGTLFAPAPGDVSWRLSFLGGLLGGGLLLLFFYPTAFADPSARSLPLIVVAGLLVGFGTRLGSGCTSGHGVCGISRLSARSLVSTLTFIGSGAVAVLLSRHFFGGAT